MSHMFDNPVLANALKFALDQATTEGKITIGMLIIVSFVSWTVIINKARQLYKPTPTLDFILSQKLTRNLTAKFGAKNLLNPKIERTYGKNSDLIYSSYRRGRAFGLSLTYEF